MYERVMRIFAMLSILLLIGVITGVTAFAKGKEKVYVSLENYAKSDQSSNMKLKKKEILNIHSSDLEEADLTIPLLATVVEKDIIVESDYQNHIIYVTIKNIPNKYFDDHFIMAKEGYILEGYSESGENQVKLEITLSDLYENQIMFKNGTLMLTFFKPKELFAKVVLINLPDIEVDAIDQAGQLDEEIIIFEVARRVRSLFLNSDTKIYLLKTKEKRLTLEERVEFTEKLDPDITVTIELAKSTSALEEGIATYYNELYFIPFFGNKQLADHIEYYTLKETEAKVLGIFSENQEDSFLSKIEMPAAKILIGYSTNEKEKDLLKTEEYLNKIALGLYNGILKSCKAMDAIEVN